MEQAIFAAGMFLPLQHYMDQVPGVVGSLVGYTGGATEDPTYEDVMSGTTGHVQAILLEFDTSKVSFAALVKHFFRMHDPMQTKLGADDGVPAYRSIIFYLTDDQKLIAEGLIRDYEKRYSRAMMTEILPAGAFYRAEAYRQKYAARTGHGIARVPYESVE